jgi:2-polyprenyl-3-methyl-5-hydroxy-6-metoxy-1,4-benzoquinol methylase
MHMSHYENYSDTSANYDYTRVPVGVEIICGCLAQGELPLAQQQVLDAGCGTGNYSKAMLAHVGRVNAVDLNANMLDLAREKCAQESTAGRITFHQSAIDSLPFDDAVFDGIIINQVLHHLPLEEQADFSGYRAVFAEFARVLKPGGALTVNTCSHEQLKHGFWYYDLIPDETRRMCQRHASLEILQQIMTDSGISYQGCFVPLDALMQGEAYRHCRGPLSKQWRDGDSIWSTVSVEKIDQICAQLEALDRSGELENLMYKNDSRRQHIGQLSFLYGHRA